MSKTSSPVNMRSAANRKRIERDHIDYKACLDAFLPDFIMNWSVLRFFMPKVKSWIWTRIEPTGYDRLSYRIGTHRKDLWTCKYIVEQTARHAGAPVEDHESGALGLGTGLLKYIPFRRQFNHHYSKRRHASDEKQRQRIVRKTPRQPGH